MSIEEITTSMVGNPELFWAALGALAQTLEAIVVLFSAIAVIFQLRHMRQESIENSFSA